MSILDVTEDQIFQTLGKGKDPNFKPIEKVRPAVVTPKKTYSINQKAKAVPVVKAAPPPVETVVQPVITVTSPQTDESVRKLTEDLNDLNNRVTGLQKTVKWYIVPQFVVVLILILVIIAKA